jgi:regulatory protein
VSILTEIRVPRRGSRRRTLVLDGEPWRDAPSDVVSEARLKQGAEVDPAALSHALAEAEPRCARDRAVRLLTYRERSAKELTDRLREDGYLPETVASVLERLVAAGLLDDERFARSLARNLTQIRRLGRSRASRELAAHGIDPLLASEALDEALSVEDEGAAAGELARTLALRTGATRDKVAAKLLRRGYAPRVALTAAREAMSAVECAGGGDPWDTSGPDAPSDGLDGI